MKPQAPMMDAFEGTVVRDGDALLLGGVAAHHSSPFEKEEHARQYCEEVARVNVASGRPAKVESIRAVRVPAHRVILAGEVGSHDLASRRPSRRPSGGRCHSPSPLETPWSASGWTCLLKRRET